MKTSTVPAEMTSDAQVPNERGYASWKRRKIEQAQAQARDRDALIPAEQVWRDLGLER